MGDIDDLIFQTKKKKKKKKGKKKKDPIKAYQKSLKEYRKKIDYCIKRVNRIDPRTKFKYTYDFMDYSIYEYSKKPLPISSYQWRMKFLSYYLAEVKEKLEIIVDNIYKDVEFDPELQWEAKEAIVCKIYEDLVKLIECVSGKGRYNNILLQSNFYTIYANGNGNHKKYGEEIKEVIDSLVRVAKQPNRDMDILINDIFLLSYVMMTGSFKFKNLPPFRKFDGKDLTADFYKILNEYGKALYKAFKKRDVPIMFKAFRSAVPQIVSNQDNTSNKNMNLAIVSLCYTSWMIGDPVINDIIGEIICK